VIGLGAAVLGAAAALAATGATPSVATTDRTAIEKIVRDYILENPEILPEAMERLEAKTAAKAVAANRKQIETPYAGAWEGNPNADVVLVEFFDYACGYCRASLPDIDRLLKDDPKLKIVYREMPVLGPDSVAAAELSLKVAKTGRYAAFHRAAYAARPDAAARAKLAQQFGVDAKAKDPAVEAEIAGNLQLQNALRLTGTPSWVVGDKVLAGAVGYDVLKAAVAEARAAKK
jgi:protein-disulfide isomerase